MNLRSNIDHEREENKVGDADRFRGEENQEGSGSYYYDDTTGYEVFEDGNEEDGPAEDLDV